MQDLRGNRYILVIELESYSNQLSYKNGHKLKNLFVTLKLNTVGQCSVTTVAVGMEFPLPFPSHSHRNPVGIPMGIPIGIPIGIVFNYRFRFKLFKLKRGV